MTNLERRALMGDRQAQEECTRRGIILACPFCGGHSEIHKAEAIAEYAEKKRDVPSGARILRKIVYPSGTARYEYRRKTFVPRCCKTSCAGRTGKQYKTIEEALAKWNTRPAPPIGRCGECGHLKDDGGVCLYCEVFNMTTPGPEAFCCRFEPKGGEENG